MTRSTSRSGRWIVLAIVGLGAGMGLAGLLLREARGPSLPLKPGAIVVVTCEPAAKPAGLKYPRPADPNRTTFSAAFAPSSEFVANLGSLWTGKMPRESGLVRNGDALRADLPTLAEIVTGQGFVAAAFVARDADELKKSGLARGFASVDARPEASDAELAAKAAEWLVGRGTAPSLAWLHLRGEMAVDGFVARLHELHVDEHAVIVTAGPFASSAGGRVGLTLRLPVTLLPLRVDPQPVSLVDVVASLVEAFGVRAPDGIGTPYLMHPDVREPHFVLTTRPLSGAFADADELWLHTTKVEYVNAPVSGSPEPDTPLAKELRAVVEERFRYQFEEVDLAELLKSEAARSPPVVPVHSAASMPARIPIARSTRSRPSK